MRIVRMCAALALLCLPLQSVHAQERGAIPYDHNDSQVVVNLTPDNRVIIYYELPRPGLPRSVHQNTVLFTGTYGDDGKVSGDARLFSDRCGTVRYHVEGWFDEEDNLTLDGMAPVRRDCKIVRYEWNTNSHLYFQWTNDF